MPRLFVPEVRLRGDTVTLEAEDHHYLTKVLRLAVGDELAVFDGIGAEWDARISKVGGRSTEVALLGRRTVPSASPAPITLVQAIPRGDRMDWIVQKATELGVSRVVAVLTKRSVARPPAGAARATRWATIAEGAARQSGRADVPAVEGPLPLAEALERAEAFGAARFVLWEGTRGRPLRQALPSDASRGICLLIGPEGGFEPQEVAAAEARGFVPVGLGPRILRVETAALVALALVQAEVGGLD
jgi:16S rRNA (uracil1498-N3)-methyltransferase